MPDALFKSSDQFKTRFTLQLESMLACEELGVFILVLANATSSTEVYRQLADDLGKRFQYFRQKLELSSSEEISKLAPDDISVFRQLVDIGLQALPLTQSRTDNEWQIQFNRLRSFRPVRNSQRPITQITHPFDPKGFHFNKPFLKNETLWQGQVANTEIEILYNKFPFADFHGIIVIEPEQCRPQYLLAEHCDEVNQFMLRCSNLSGFGLAYNSLGAYASINHQHWQSFISRSSYPIESSRWTHNGGQDEYPLKVFMFDSLPEAWTSIEGWQQNNMAFNLLVRADKVFAITRKRQGSYQHSGWTTGFAWSEIMGNYTTGQLLDFQQLDTTQIVSELSLLSLD